MHYYVVTNVGQQCPKWDQNWSLISEILIFKKIILNSKSGGLITITILLSLKQSQAKQEFIICFFNMALLFNLFTRVVLLQILPHTCPSFIYANVFASTLATQNRLPQREQDWLRRPVIWSKQVLLFLCIQIFLMWSPLVRRFLFTTTFNHQYTSYIA